MKKKIILYFTIIITKRKIKVNINNNQRKKEIISGNSFQKEALDTHNNYRKKHHVNNLVLNKDLCIGIFPEGTINRTKDIIMPFKIGAVKMSHDTNSKIVPFIITGKYRVFGKSVRIEFLKPISIGEDLSKENDRLMDIVKDKLKENRQ